MKQRHFLNALITATFIAPLHFLPTYPSAQAQGDAWLVGDQWVEMDPMNGEYKVTPLPQQTLGYNGAIAEYSQLARTDGNNDLFFFIVDGNIYDGDGYLILPAVNSSGDQNIHPGTTKILALPVPGSCSMFYIVSSWVQNGLNAIDRVMVSILDMDMQNPNFPTMPDRRGRVVDLWTDLDPGQPYHQYQAWIGPGIPLHQYQNEIASGITNGSNRIELAAIDPGWSNGDLILNCLITAEVFSFVVTPTSIDLQWTAGNPTPSASGDDDWEHDSEFGIDQQTGDILFALTTYQHEFFPDQTPLVNPFQEYPITVFRMSGTTGLLLPNGIYGYAPAGYTGNAPGPVPDHIYGCAFAENGSQLVFTRPNHTPNIGYIDLASGLSFGIPTPGVANPTDRTHTHLQVNAGPDGITPAIFFGYSGNVAMLEGVDDLATATWTDQLPVTQALNTVPLGVGDPTIGSSAPYLLSGQFFQDQNILSLRDNDDVCCAFRAEVAAEPGFTSTGSNSYANAYQPCFNPWNNGGEVYFSEDVVIQGGHTVYVRDMTWRFAEGKRLILEPGGRALFYNCVLTNFGCDEERWRGVEVRGDWSQVPWHSDQGRLSLYNNTVVENAEYAVLCSRWNNGTFDITGGGGAVRAFNSTFRNNIYGPTLFGYLPNNAGINSLCLFSNCDFITDSDWPDPGVNYPRAHLLMWSVNDVKVYSCSFANDDAGSFPMYARGIGVYGVNAGFDVLASNPDPAQHYMRDLYLGMLNSVPNTALSYRVRGMHFEKNGYGILDMGSTDPRIHLNSFLTLEDAWNFPSVGLYLYQSELYSVEQNIFNGFVGGQTPGIGIHFFGPTHEDNRIYHNDFYDLEVACNVEGEHSLNGVLSNDIGLQMLCGDHLNNTFDQAILLNSTLRFWQGENSIDPDDPANNQFRSSPDCASTWEIWTDPASDPCGSNGLCVKYWYYDHPSNPEHRPECVDGTHVDDVYDLQFSQPQLNPFDRATHCTKGDLLITQTIVQLLNGHTSKIGELASAWNAYNETVDGGEKPDLIELINYNEPWHPSHMVRDALLGQHPLSDEVMSTALWREQPLDHWHLCQVLIDNSPLEESMYADVEDSEKLNPFFMALLDQAQNEEMSTRQVLEMEIMMRHEEKDRLQHRLLSAWASDTTGNNPVDSVIAWLQRDTFTTGSLDLYRQYVKTGMTAEANALGVELSADRDRYGTVLDLGAVELAIGGDWLTSAQSTDWDEVNDLAFGDDRQGKGEAWALLHLFSGRTDSVPTAILPGGTRSAPAWDEHRPHGKRALELAVFPNPASGSAWFTLPEGFPGGVLEITDAQGRLVRSLQVGSIFVEVDLTAIDAGAYTASLQFEGMQVATSKFVVTR